MSAISFPALTVIEPPAMRNEAVAATPSSAGPIPPDAQLRVFRSRSSAHLFVADGSRIYDIDDDTADLISRDRKSVV